jgi:hypothetical protein
MLSLMTESEFGAGITINIAARKDKSTTPLMKWESEDRSDHVNTM